MRKRMSYNQKSNSNDRFPQHQKPANCYEFHKRNGNDIYIYINLWHPKGAISHINKNEFYAQMRSLWDNVANKILYK
jgi:hypothetical protein